MPPPARKRFGQHFLERPWAARVLDAIRPGADETFIEIGPGRGALTRPLAAAVAHLVAVEIDRDLVAALRAQPAPNITLVARDFLTLTAAELVSELRGAGTPPGVVRIAGNLPYNVASPILRKLGQLFREGLRFRDATLMLQREVAERLLAPVGTRDYGVLTVFVRHWAEVDPLLPPPPGAFRPAPKVRSLLVRLRPHEPDPLPRSPEVFARMTQAIFTRRRKTLANALLAYEPPVPFDRSLALEQAGLDGRRRPETLDLADLVRLADAIGGAVL